MGIVYKAEDTTLGRTVALKFLSARLLDNDEAKKRFFREAKAAAALHHPNICTIYEISEHGDETFLVMAYLEGETLEDRISKGPLPLRDAIDICRQVAEGLEAAHDKGIVHRDIKPGNILVSPEGRATILDFGLARLTEASRLTKTAAALGTVAYMSPEQAQGEDVDHRTDVWSLGCVLYEMVLGQRPFRGAYDQAILYEIACEEPEPLTAKRTDVPLELEFITTKCLAKDAASRYQQAREVSVDLRNLQDKLRSGRSAVLRTAVQPISLLPAARPAVSKRELIWQVLVGVCLLALLVLAVVHFQQPEPSSPVVEFSVSSPQGLPTAELALSPNGRRLVVSTLPSGSLWLRSLDSRDWQELPGTKGARYPFWSPDSAWIAFFADGRLRKIALSGGPPETLASASDGRGGSWGADGTILFAPAAYGQIQHVSSSGGQSLPLGNPSETTAPARRFPHLLPDGRHYLFSEDKDAAPDESGVFLGSLDNEPARRLLADSSNAVYVPRTPKSETGFLLFVREGALMAQPFDPSRLELSGAAASLSANPASGENAGFYAFSASPTGVLAHSAAPANDVGPRRLVWVDRTGAVTDDTGLQAENLSAPRLSPDGTRVAYSAREGSNDDVWVYDLARGARTRLTNDPRADSDPIWSPDGQEVIFRSDRDRRNLYLRTADGSGSAETISASGSNVYPTDWSTDGRFVVFRAQAPETRVDLWYLERSLNASRVWEPHLFLGTPLVEVYARLSPDGRYAAYISEESGRREVYVQPFPAGGPKTTVSREGGGAPVWSRNGKELFYVTDDNVLTVVSVSTRGEFSISAPTRLFRYPDLAGPTTGMANYDISLNGRRFLVVEPVDATLTPDQPIHMIINWPARFSARP